MRYFLFCFICFWSLQHSAQELEFGERLEFELKNDYDHEEVYNFGENGMVMRAESRKSDDNGNTTWKYDFYDTDLKLKVSVPVKLKHNIDHDETFTSENYIHELFVRKKKRKYYIVTLEVSTGKLFQIEGELASRKMSIRDMKVMGDRAFFYARLKRAPVIFTVNWKTGEKKVIPISIKDVKPRKMNLTHMQLLEEANEVFVYMEVPVDRREEDTFVIRLNAEGQKEEIFRLTDEEVDEEIAQISGYEVGDGHYIYIGTYSEASSAYSTGLFFAESKNSERTQLELYKFVDLENFLDYLSDRKKERLEKKKKRKEKRGKELKLNYRIAGHDIMVLDDGYLFLGEAYYPTYSSSTTVSYVNGMPTYTTTHVFDGYQYTHAILAKFDREGALLWDETFEMWQSKKPFYVKRFIQVQEDKADRVNLAYASYSTINTKSISFEGEVVAEEESEEIETGNEGDKTRRSDTELEYWYNDYFISFGQQKIKNKEDEDVKKRRKVFFLQKIKF